MSVISLLLNIAVLVPVTASLILDAAWTRDAFGPKSPARGILLAVYLAILAASVALLVAVLTTSSPAVLGALAGLLAVQVVYKLMTPFTVGSVRNPVVLSNLGIAAVHLVTLVTLAGSL
jgi:hypothetical protein